MNKKDRNVELLIMETKLILKNKDKYDILKMASGINLGVYMNIPENYFRAPDRFTNSWIKQNDKYVYFKSKEFYSYIYTQKNRSVNELVVDIIAKQIGIQTAKYEPAHLYHVHGIISHDVTKSYEELLTLSDLFDVSNYDTSMDFVDRAWNDSYMVNYEADKKQIMFDLYKMLVLDALTMQEDRHANNIFFIRDTEDNSIRLAPLIDNEFAFALKTVDNFIKNKAYRDEEGYDKDKFLRIHSTFLQFSAYPENSAERYKKYGKNVKDLIELAVKKPQYKEFLINSLKNASIEKAICAVEKMGYEISPEYRQYMCDVVNLAKHTFADKIKEVRSSQNYSQRS